MPWRVALAFGDVGLTLRADHPEIEAAVARRRRGLRPPAERMEQISAERFEIGRMIPESVHDAVDAGRLAAGALPFRETPELPLLLGAASQVMARVAQVVHEIVGRERVPDAQTPSPEEDDRGRADDARVVRPQVAGAVLLGRLPVWVSHAESVGRMPPVQADPHGERHAHGVFFPDHVAEDHLGKLPDDPCDDRDGKDRDDQADDAQIVCVGVKHLVHQTSHVFLPGSARSNVPNCRRSTRLHNAMNGTSRALPILSMFIFRSFRVKPS